MRPWLSIHTRLDEHIINADRTQVCLLSMCGIYQGPFAHLRSSLASSYVNYFETDAARELFEFQSSEAEVSQQHAKAYESLLRAGVKTVHIGSIDDNVVPLYSALNASASHPSILRALYIDGTAFSASDFLINLLVLCVAVRNGGFHDHNLLTLLSASVAGSLYAGHGHYLVYDEPAVYDLATRYLFETSTPRASGAAKVPLVAKPFVAKRWNPYEIPWSLRGLLEDENLRMFYAESIGILIRDFQNWHPIAKPLKNLQWRLSPIRTVRLPPTLGASDTPHAARDAAGLTSATIGDAQEQNANGVRQMSPKL